MLGVFGGSGFYSFLDDATDVTVDTPFGSPSAAVRVGRLGDIDVAFLPRHGVHHHLPPHRVDYRANVWAMREVGVRRLIGPCAAGSLQPDVRPGDFVVCDQLVDRTSGRRDTYYDGPQVHHVSFADPYCPSLRAALVASAGAEGVRVHDGGTVAVIQGPRFSTRAESRWFRDAGWHVVNMTQYPEAYLARELGLCYATVAIVTDYDAGLASHTAPEEDASHTAPEEDASHTAPEEDRGVSGIEAVTMDEVLRVFDANLEKLRAVLFRALPSIPATPAPGTCRCAEGLAADKLAR